MNFKKTWKRFFTVSRASEGFTLVELIVVIAILAILAGIAVPAYSGYIKKANKAADLQLLGAVNTAFAAAALENGDDVSTLTGPNMPLTGDEGSRTINTDNIQPAEYKDAFIRYFEGNTGAFKVISGLVWDNNKKSFCDVNDATEISFSYRGNTVTMSPEAAAALMGSTWGTTATSEELLGLVTNVTGMASGIDNGVYQTLLTTPAYMNAAAAILGTDAANFQNKVGELTMAEFNTWLENNPDATTDEQNAKRAEIGQSIMANTTVLVAAQNAQAASSSIMSVLTGENVKDTIKGTMVSDPTTGLSQAALAYGLYSSYMYHTDADSFNPNAPLDFSTVMNTLEDDDFQEYLTSGQGQTDLNGYLAALNTVSANNSVAGTVAVNGFNDAQLATLLGQVMGK